MKKTIKFGLKAISKPSPEKYRKIGRILGVVSTAITGTAFWTGYPIIMHIAGVCSFLSLLIPELFSEEGEDNA